MLPKQLFAGVPRGPAGDCSQNCSCSILTTQQRSTSRFSKLLKPKTTLHRVFTQDPMCPRQFSAYSENALFSNTYVSMRYGHPVEACGTLLNPEAPGSYKFIYSAFSTPDVPHVAPRTISIAQPLWLRRPKRHPCNRFKQPTPAQLHQLDARLAPL
jgi:hypothetical protein